MTGAEIQEQLRAALRAAMKAREAVAVSALRSVLAAIANAEAVPAAPPGQPAASGSEHVAGSVAGLWAAQARRRELSGADIAAIIGAEVTERRRAAGQYDRTGNADRAARLRGEAEVIESALPGSATGAWQ